MRPSEIAARHARSALAFACLALGLQAGTVDVARLGAERLWHACASTWRRFRKTAESRA